jgi:hypothetical protein
MIDNKTPDMERAMQGGYSVRAYFMPALSKPQYVKLELAHDENTLALFVASPENASEAFQHPSAYSADVCAILK